MEALKGLTLTECKGLTEADMTVLSTMNLTSLIVSNCNISTSLQSFAGSNISRTLETFQLWDITYEAVIDDDRFAATLASCHRLKTLHVRWGGDGGCVFGRSGLDGLQAMAIGCPLLANVKLFLTVDGIHCLGTHCTNLQKCHVFNRFNRFNRGVVTHHPKGLPSASELQTLYSAVKWIYCCA